MEGSYNHPVKRAQTSLSAQTQPATYQVNVSRKKTRKWVEAKVQNYDGDDWGAEEYDEESDQEPVPPPPINPSLRTFSGTDLLHSRHNTPSPASSLSALPSLRTQAQQQQQQPAAVPPPASQPPRIGVSSPDVSEVSIRSASESIASGHGVSPQSVTASQGHDGDSNLSLAGIAKLPSQMQQQGQQQQASGGYDVSRSSSFERSIKPTPTPPVAGDRSLSPQLSAPSVPPADQPPPIIYSPDNYSRLHDDNEREPLAPAPVMPWNTQGEQSTDFAPKTLSGEDRRDTWERDDDSPHADQPDNQGARPDIESQAGIDRGRMSISPKLPDLARLSAFGADLFSSSTSKNHILSKNAPNIPPVIESSPDISTAHQSRWQPPAVPAEDEDHSEAPGGASLSQPNSLFPGRSIPDIPPLRTPSPHETHAAVSSFDSQATKITPTEPLQPRRGEALPDLDDPQSFRRVQTYGTAESSPLKDSPVKESDVLSDEIMRTLGPSGVAPAEVKLSDGPQLHPPEDRSAVRESSYTLMDYDSYWADTAEDSGLGHENAPVPPPENIQSAPAAPETSPAHAAQPGLKLSTNPTPPPATATTVTFDSILSPQQSQQLLHEQQQQEELQQSQQQDEQQPRSSLRRRFSWEAEEGQRTPTTPAQAPGDGSSASALHLKPFEPSVTNLNNESRSHSPVSQLSQAPPTATGSGLGGLALQTSGTLPGYDSSLPEPPSPVSVSVKSDKPYTTDREQARLSIADEKLLADQGSVSLVTGTPPPPLESHPAVSSPTSAVSVPPAPQAPAPNPNPLAHTKAMGFREIMALPTPAERIAKYTEARQALAARDSGLESWLLYLMTEHPELSASISTPGGHLAPQSTNNASLPAGSQAPSQQQPYYQQYLNASSPSTTVPQVGGGGGGGSGSGSGGGRSRLGGLSMPSQMSGSAFGHSGNQIGTKSKEFMQSAGKMGKGLLSKGKSKLRGSGDKVDIVPPDHPTPNKAQRRSTWRFSLEPKPRDDSAPHSSDDISTTPPQLPDPSPVSPLNAASGPGAAFPWNVSDDMPDPYPSAGKQPDEEHIRSGELVIAGAFLHGAHVSADQEENMLSAGHRLSDLSPDAVTPDDWVMVQHQGEQSRAKRMSTSLRVMGNAGSGPAIGLRTDHHAGQPQTQTQSQPQVQYQPLDGSGSPRRNSSFIGLPPIRRGSTFGTKSKARRASERFALDDDDDDDDEDDAGLGGAGADINSPHLPPVSGIDASTHASEAVKGAELRFGQEYTANAGHPHHSQQRQWQQQSQQPQQLGQQQQQHRQHYPSGHEPQFAPAAPMLDSLVQKLPPAGPWKLEESHLSEPLHLTKKRSGTDFSQQDAYYGYDKELGLEFPAAPMPAPPGPPTRFRSDVPPSSARRYPELFQLSPGQDPRQYGRGQGFPPPMQNRPPREGIAAPRQQQGGPESDDRGRRRSAGIFKDIGSRLARATSRERRGSASEARPPSLQLRGDEASETSVATEDTADRKRKRASFLGFSGRPSSTEQAVRREEGMSNQARQRDTQSAGGEPPADPREERKRTFFGAGQLKLGPGNFSRSFTSNSPFESAAGAAGDGRDGGTAHKRRISDIAKVSGITGLFSRSRQDRASLGAMPKQQTDDRSQHPQTQNQAATVSRPSIQLPSLNFASDPLGSMSSLGFEESFQNYGREGDVDKKQQQQEQHAFEKPAQRLLADSKAFPAVGGQERFAALLGSASPQFKPSSQIMALDPGPRNAQSHQPPPSTATPVARTNIPHTGPLTLYPAATEGQRVSGHEALETSPKSQVDSTMEEKTPRPQDFFFQEKVPPLPVKEDDVSEEDVLRSQTVSPDISIASTSKTQGQAPVQLESHTPEHDEIVEGVLITPPPEESLLGSDADLAAGRSVIHHTVSNDVPPSVHSFPSVSSLREKSDAKSIQQGVGSVHQTEGSVAPSPGPSPQAAKSQVSSKAATPVSQHQQLHSPASAAVRLPDTQNIEPPATPRSHTRSESQQQQLVDAAGQRLFPTSASPLPTGTQAPQQLLRPQYPPSVSVSNASFASEVSTPVHPVQFGSQTLNPGAPGPFGRASTQPPEAAAQPKDGQASRWKGLKNRMTEQISQRTQQPQQQQQYAQQQSLNPGQNKIAMGDLIRGNKLLGALRRTSRQVEGTQNQGNVEPFPRQFQNPSPQPHPQGYQQQPGQLQGPQPNAMSANSQYLQASGQPPNLPRAKTMPPGPPQQCAPPRDQTRSSEPRYETVPIPRGYAAVHGEGTMTIPSPYHQNLRRQMPHGQSAPLPQQHPHPHPHVQQRQQWQGGAPPPMSDQLSPPRMALDPVSAPLPNVRTAHMRAQSDLRVGYPDHRTIDSPNARLSQHNRHSSQGSHTSRAEAWSTSGLGSNLGTSHPGSPQPSEKGNLSGVDGTRSAPRSPAVSVGADEKPGIKPEPKTTVTVEPTPASDLGIDVEKAQQLVEDDLYDATPKVVPSGTEDSHEASDASQTVQREEAESSRSAETKTGLTPADTGVVAELEDTEEARKRAIRLASQEEKIYYEPEDYEPKMTATSYPGQEWNPFGEPEFADWKEE